MTISRKAILATLAGAALLAGCASGPYYDDYYGYNGYDRYGYYDPAYYPGYVAPSVGLGFTYSDRDYYRYDRDHRRGYNRGETRLERDVREGRRDPEGRPIDNPTGGDLGTGRDPRANPNNSPG